MASGTVPIQTCDDESGCDQWMLDYYAMTASNWRELLGGWTFDPRTDHALCQEHAAIRGEQQ